MGKNLIQQARGRGGPTYRAPSHNFRAEVRHRAVPIDTMSAIVKDIVTCPAHSAPLAFIEYDDKIRDYIIAPEGIKVGDKIQLGLKVPSQIGNMMIIKNIPEGTLIHNIENAPGDGGKFVRASGGFAKIIAQTVEGAIVELPSKSQKIFNGKCLAAIGIVAGGGRPEKPILRAGTKMFKMKAKNKLWPKTGALAMNAVDHPYGGSRSSRKGRPTIAPKNAPRGRKVGMIRPPTTGRGRLAKDRESKKIEV